MSGKTPTPGRAGISVLYLSAAQERFLRAAASTAQAVSLPNYQPLTVLAEYGFVTLSSVKKPFGANKYRATAAGKAWLRRVDELNALRAAEK